MRINKIIRDNFNKNVIENNIKNKFNERVIDYESGIENIYDLVLFGLIYDIQNNKAARTAYINKARDFYNQKETSSLEKLAGKKHDSDI